ncbi:hypothetical protein LJR039_004363 [Pseudorhodoferax sp. LjRoot39]|uniref:hypothetical protein n=1 Tax=Pseudorhodoferax sp. LjRoot39 TaxID=3342328 RepID=UPI003ECD4B66
MLTFDSATTSALNGATSKTLWCELLALSLGGSRKMVCARADSGDPFNTSNATRQVFRDLDLSGAISTDGAFISNFGSTRNARVKLATDLSTGVAALRITNTDGSRWIQGSLGLPGSGADFILGANPTASSGESISAAVLPPQTLASGLGPAAPEWHARTPKTVVLESYASGVWTEVDRVDFTERQKDVSLSHQFLGGQIGDVAWWIPSRSMRLDGPDGEAHWFFPQLFRHDASCGRSGARPYETIWVSARPVDEQAGDWNTFPAMGTGPQSGGTIVYDKENPRHSTIPLNFRLRYLNTAGVEEGRSDWPDLTGAYPQGRPINDRTAVQNQFYNPATGGKAALTVVTPPAVPDGTGPAWGDAGVVVEPFWNIAQPIWWESEMPADMPGVLMNGFASDVLIPQARYYSTTNPADYLYARYADQMLGLNFPWVMTEYPRSRGVQTHMTPADPQSSDPNNVGDYRGWAIGYRSVAGWRNGHDIYPGPGGQRFDRAAIPHQVALFLSDRDGVRTEGAVPNRTIAWEFCKGYANLSRAFVKDRFLGSIPKSEGIAGAWNLKAAHYGSGNKAYDKQIEMCKIADAKYQAVDYAGRHPYSWQQPEGIHHGYTQAGIGLLAFKDIRFAILQRFHWDTHWMSTLGYSGASANPAGETEGHFGTRQGAWRFQAHLFTWLSAGEHPLLHSMSSVENRFQTELQLIGSNIWQPAMVANEPTLYMQGVKRFGQPMKVGNNVNGGVEVGGNKAYYMGLIAFLMKTSGMWDKMKAKSPGCANGLAATLHMLDTGSIDWVMGTDAKWTGYVFAGDPNDETNDTGTNSGHMVCSADKTTGTPTVADLPADWYGVPAVMSLNNLDAGFLKTQNGAFRITDWDPPEHNRAAWPALRLMAGFAADYPKANVAAARDRFAGYYAERTAWSNESTTEFGKMSRNCRSRIVPMGFPNPLAEV